MLYRKTIAGMVLAVSLAGPALAQSDADLLSAIPDSDYTQAAAEVQTLPAEGDAMHRPNQKLRWHLETNVTHYDRRQPLPNPHVDLPSTIGRARLVAEGGFALGKATTFRLNAAMNGRWVSNDSFDFQKHARFDLREAYLLHEQDNFVLEGGRINIRNGVAIGFNPTDFFRGLNADQSPNLDPSEARLNRLGVVALRVGYLWDTGSASLTYSPKITGGSDWWHDHDVWGLNLSVTNPRDRFLLSYTQEVAEGISPELYLFVDDDEVTGGLAASASIGDRWLVYGEMTHGRGRTILDSSLSEARKIGRLSRPINATYGDKDNKQMLTRVALGASYTFPSNLLLTTEYLYNEAGFSGKDWDRYFDLAKAVDGDVGSSRQLASMFLYGAYLQEPVSKHSLFLRAVQSELANGKLTLSGISNISLVDQSGSGQIEAAYEVTEDFIVTGRVGVSFGGRKTDFGSQSSRAFSTLKLNYHF